jgi:hypothetical protein
MQVNSKAQETVLSTAVTEPDRYLNNVAIGVLDKLKGQPASSPLFPELLAQLKGFDTNTQVILNVIGTLNRRLNAGLNADQMVVVDKDYDPEGIIGFKFGKPESVALILQPAEPNEDFCCISVVFGGRGVLLVPDAEEGLTIVLNRGITPGSDTDKMVREKFKLEYKNIFEEPLVD